MQRLLVLFPGLFFFSAISAQSSDNWPNELPASFQFGQELKKTAFVPADTLLTGVFDGADSFNFSKPHKTVFSSFHIWKYEISNQEYRAFVQDVLDSVCRERLGYYRYVNGQKQLDRKRPVNLDDERLEPLMVTPDDRIFKKKLLNTSQLFYARPGGDSIAVYPDTTVWRNDIPFQYNEIARPIYFSHPAFNNYPVAGISFWQARAYCVWKTKKWNEALQQTGDDAHEFLFRLPTAVEWEVAATDFPAVETFRGISYWFPIMNEQKTAYLYNFGQIFDSNGFLIKGYSSDNSFYTEPVHKGTVSKRGLYHIHGNVAEWTSDWGYYTANPDRNTGKDESLETYRQTFPGAAMAQMDAAGVHGRLKKYKIVKGGSWASNPFYLQPAVNQYYLPETQRAMVGFRMVVEYRLKQFGAL